MRLFVLMALILNITLVAQGFDSAKDQLIKFKIDNSIDRNNITFFSSTPLEDIKGTANELSGEIQFNPSAVQNSITGEVTVKVASMKTGISLRDKHLRSEDWLNEDEYPEIKFSISSIEGFSLNDKKKTVFTAKGKITIHGISKEVNLNTEMAYLSESEKTKSIAPGDLINVKAGFSIKLSDFGVNNIVIGEKVSEDIRIEINVVGYSG